LSTPRLLELPICRICALCFLIVYSLSGCSARNPTANRPTPPPDQSVDASSSGEESSSRERADPSPNPRPAKRMTSARSTKPAPVQPSAGYTAEGNASWYGIPFHGRHASNGEIYDMHKLTAAHRTLPFDTMVRVTNLTNGKSTVVRITDRGPFIENRIIDLSMAAAREIEAVGPGVVPIRLEVLGNGNPNTAFFP